MNKNVGLIAIVLGALCGVGVFYLAFNIQDSSTTEVSERAITREVKNEIESQQTSQTVQTAPEVGTYESELHENVRLGGLFVSKSTSGDNYFNFEVKQSNSPDFGKIVVMDMSLCNANAVILGAHYFVKTAYSIERGIYICSDAAELKINGQQ